MQIPALCCRKDEGMRGTLYGVGVGPGDPRLMTCLAIETIKACPVVAVPARGRDQALSYRIAKGMVEDLEKKECLALSTPMTRDLDVLNQNYEQAAEKIIACLDAGKDVAYLTLGDPSIYSTYIYIHRLVKRRGYGAEMVSGVPSFCAAAARTGESLADRAEQLHILPSSYAIEEALDAPGTKVLMKAGSQLLQIKQMLSEKGMDAEMVENCGMESERRYLSVEEMPDEAGYYTIILVKER